MPHNLFIHNPLKNYNNELSVSSSKLGEGVYFLLCISALAPFSIINKEAQGVAYEGRSLPGNLFLFTTWMAFM